MSVLNRSILQAMRVDITHALADVAQRYGVTIEAGNATFASTFAKFQLHVQVKGAGSPDAARLREFAAMYGLPADAVGRTINHAGREFVIKGINARGSKVIVEGGGGKGYLIPVEIVRACLGGAS